MKRAMISSAGATVLVPHLEQYFGVWAMAPDRLEQMVGVVLAMDLSAHVAEEGVIAEDPKPFTMEGGIEATYDRAEGFVRVGRTAVIDISGTMTKYGSSMSSGGSTVRARQQLAKAVKSESVDGIVLRIDSPGGSVAGTIDLADEVAAANRIKPVSAFIEDTGASAAYWVASQAGTIIANRGSEVGSIGVFAAIRDMSGHYAQNGVKVHVIKAGAYKGAGVQGTEITPEMKAEWQRSVDEAYARFTAAVAQGRRMTLKTAEDLADGRAWGAEDALAKGLIDRVGSLGTAINAARGSGRNAFLTAKAKPAGHGVQDAKEKVMNFSDSLKAVLEGKPEAAIEEQRQCAIDAVAQVRAFDKAGHEKTASEAREAGKTEGQEAGKSSTTKEATDAAVKAERERSIEIVGICMKLGLPMEKTAAHIAGGKSAAEVAKEAVGQASIVNPGLKMGRDAAQAAADPRSEDQRKADDMLVGMAKEIGGKK